MTLVLPFCAEAAMYHCSHSELYSRGKLAEVPPTSVRPLRLASAAIAMDNDQRGHFTNFLLADEQTVSDPPASYTQPEQLQLCASESGPECLSSGLLAYQLSEVRGFTLNDERFLLPAGAGQAHVPQAALRVAAGLQQDVELPSSCMVSVPSIGSPLQPLHCSQYQQQQQQPGQQALRHTSVAPAVSGTPTFQMYRSPPFTTESLVTAGDQLLQVSQQS